MSLLEDVSNNITISSCVPLPAEQVVHTIFTVFRDASKLEALKTEEFASTAPIFGASKLEDSASTESMVTGAESIDSAPPIVQELDHLKTRWIENRSKLPPTQFIKEHFQEFRGPMVESNLVFDLDGGKLYAGAYIDHHREGGPANTVILDRYKELGVNLFANLCKEYGNPVYSRDYPLYHQHLTAEEFVHFPIRDCDIVDSQQTFDFALSLVRQIYAGKSILVHCQGGHGRTGVIVSIILMLLFGFDPTEAMEYCQVTHNVRINSCDNWPSPQTHRQRMQVVDIYNRFIKN
jgi:protein-tyrosine phosphatase